MNLIKRKLDLAIGYNIWYNYSASFTLSTILIQIHHSQTY